jgi:hypothetical protein
LPGRGREREVELKGEERDRREHLEERRVLRIEPGIAKAERRIACGNVRGLIRGQGLLPDGSEQQEEHGHEEEAHEGDAEPRQAARQGRLCKPRQRRYRWRIV